MVAGDFNVAIPADGVQALADDVTADKMWRHTECVHAMKEVGLQDRTRTDEVGGLRPYLPATYGHLDPKTKLSLEHTLEAILLPGVSLVEDLIFSNRALHSLQVHPLPANAGDPFQFVSDHNALHFSLTL